jgi:hypothetical protein
MPHVDGYDDGVGYGVYGESNVGNGVYGVSQGMDGYGVYGESKSYSGNGVFGKSPGGNGVYGICDDGCGVAGISGNGTGLYGESGMYYAAILNGKVKITGNLEKAGGSFKIDHPLDPANKYLCHSFVESPDMKNIYDGVVVLDDNGKAEVHLPHWFETVNKDFRYQLTAIGGSAPNLYVEEKLTNNNFHIAGGKPGMEVSWQVTGIRKDPWANANRIKVEEEKTSNERDHYLHPELYGKPSDKIIYHA